MTRRRGRRGRKGLNLPKNGKQIVLVGKGKKSVGDSRFKVFFATFLASLSAHKRKVGGGIGPKIFFHPQHTQTSSWPNFAHFSWGGKINLRLSPRGRILESEKSSR